MWPGVDIEGNGVGNYTFIVWLPVSFINMQDCFMNGRRTVSLIYCVALFTAISFLYDYYHLSNVVRVLYIILPTLTRLWLVNFIHI